MAKHSHRRFTLAALLCAVFMAAMEATVVATAMPSVVADLGGIHLYGWVGAVYLLTSTVTMPLFGKLADQRGRKPTLLWGIGLFLAGSMTSGAATSMLMLIVARGVQGLGAGAIQPIALTIVGDLYPAEQRAKVQGAFGAVWALAGVSGPLLGGFFVSALSWRWVFYVNVPFGLIAVTLLVWGYKERRRTAAHHLDLLGVVTLTVGAIALLLGVGGTASSWLLPAAAATLGLFVFVETRAKEPLVPLSLMKTPLIATSNLTYLLLGASMTGVLLFVPLFVQSVLGESPTVAGTSVAPMMLGWPLASSLSGRLLSRFGYRRMVRVGGFLIATSCVLLLLPHQAGTGPWLFRVNAFVLGMGLGFANTALIIAVQDSVAWQQRGTATAAALFFRSIGGALSAGLLGAQLAAALGDGVPQSVLSELVRPDASREATIALDRYSALIESGMREVFVTIAGMCVVGGLSTLTFPRGGGRLRGGEQTVQTSSQNAE